LSPSELKHSSIEKEAYAIVEALRKWRHFLIGRHFKLVTDQRSVSFMFNSRHSSKIKNEKILRWRLELACYNYDIVYRPGKQNDIADTLSRICSSTAVNKLYDLHCQLCHPGITRMAHWVKSRNLPYSLEEIRKMTSSCSICSEVKPRFYKGTEMSLIKATTPFERINLDFKGPLPSATRNKYLLTIIDEYSRFPFAYPCQDLSTKTVIEKLSDLFSVFGLPSYIHSDRGSSFMSVELKDFLHSKGIATSRTTPYNPQGNGQVERLNGTLWRTISLTLKTKAMHNGQWEEVVKVALHAVRSLLCTATNCTPHERMFVHQRKSPYGQSMPTWLMSPGKVWMKKHVRQSKYDPLVEEVELIEANPNYATVRLQNGHETTVSLRHLAPQGNNDKANIEDTPNIEQADHPPLDTEPVSQELDMDISLQSVENIPRETESQQTSQLRRSNRKKQTPLYLKDYDT